MKTKFYLAVTAIAITAIVFIVSCGPKASTTVNNNDPTGAAEYCLAQQISDDVTNMAGQVSEGVDSLFKGTLAVILTYASTPSATVTHDTVNKVIVVNFLGIACPDGHPRSGTLIFNYSQSTGGAKCFRNPGFKMVVSSSSYVDNGNIVTIHESITNTTPSGFNSTTTNLTWTVTDSVSATLPGDSVVTMSGTEVKTLLNTSDTTVYHGQALPITWSLARMGNTSVGNLTGTDSEGQYYVAMITTLSVTSSNGLVRDFTCWYGPRTADHPIILGGVTLTPGAQVTNYMDFSCSATGYGACDKQVGVSLNGNVRYITTE